MKYLRFAVRFASAVFLALFARAATTAQGLAPPDAKGPFNVGVKTFSATMTDDRSTRIQVFYPTLAASDGESQYTINTPAGSYQVSSLLGAVRNAQSAPGRFPLVVYDHGGAPVGADFQRVAQFPLHETMASHGFVVAVALHSGDPVTRVRDLSLRPVTPIVMTWHSSKSTNDAASVSLFWAVATEPPAAAVRLRYFEAERLVAHLEFITGVEEIFDVQVVPGARCPALSGPYPNLDSAAPIWTVPESAKDFQKS